MGAFLFARKDSMKKIAVLSLVLHSLIQSGINPSIYLKVTPKKVVKVADFRLSE